MRISPSSAPQLAEESVGFVDRKFGFRLPYTPESLIVVDAIVDKVRATGAAEQQASGILAGLGCYVGEVFVRHARASWRRADEMGMGESCRFAAVKLKARVAALDKYGDAFTEEEREQLVHKIKKDALGCM